jgi:hypothetical protein
MAYDPNSLMGLDALSPTVGAYKQFVERQNGVNDAGVVPFLVSRGEPQLAGLIAKKMRVENAAKAQQQLAQQPPAAPPTVAQQYDQAAMQQAQQARMAQGLGGMPAPTMERASFAGGGIVAFADGGGVEYAKLKELFSNPLNNPTNRPEYAPLYKRYKELEASMGGAATAVPPTPATNTTRTLAGLASMYRTPAGDFQADLARAQGRIPSTQAPSVKPPAPPATAAPAAPATQKKPPTQTAPAEPEPVLPFFQKYIDEVEQKGKTEEQFREEALGRYKELGIGKAASEFKNVLAKLKNDYEGAGADRKNLKEAIIMGAAKLMAGRGGFNEALGAAFGAGTEAYYARQKENKKAAMDLAKATFELNQAEENLRLSAAKEGSAEFNAQVKRLQGLKDAQVKSTYEWLAEKAKTDAENKRAREQNVSQEKIAGMGASARRTPSDIDKLNFERQRLNTILTNSAAKMKASEMDPTSYAQAKLEYDNAMNALQRLDAGGGTQSVMTLGDYLTSKGV